MKDGFTCAHCDAENEFSLYTRRRWESPTPQRCWKCGATHACHRGQVEVISPAMLPVHLRDYSPHLRLSPWMPPEYVPVREGEYDVEFYSGYQRRLYWNERYWQPSLRDTRRVLVGDLLKWRGVWA